MNHVPIKERLPTSRPCRPMLPILRSLTLQVPGGFLTSATTSPTTYSV